MTIKGNTIQETEYIIVDNCGEEYKPYTENKELVEATYKILALIAPELTPFTVREV